MESRKVRMSALGYIAIILGLLVPAYVYPNLPFSDHNFKFAARALVVVVFAVRAVQKRAYLSIPQGSTFKSLYALTALAITSSVYSADPALSLTRALDLVLFILVASMLAPLLSTIERAARFVEVVLASYLLGFFAIAAWLNEPFLRTMGLDGVARLGGFVINPNLFAYCALLLLLINIYLKSLGARSIGILLVLAFIEILAIWLTYSRSAFIALGICTMGLPFLLKRRKRTALLLCLFAITPILLIFSLDFALAFFERGHGLENLVTLGGRTVIWGPMLSGHADVTSLLVGYGYQMLSPSGHGVSNAESTITMAHNNFIQSYLGLGVAGATLTAMFWLSLIATALKWASRLPRQELVFICLTCGTVFIFSNVEFGIFGPSNIVTPVFFVLLFTAARTSALVSRNSADSRMQC